MVLESIVDRLRRAGVRLGADELADILLVAACRTTTEAWPQGAGPAPDRSTDTLGAAAPSAPADQDARQVYDGEPDPSGTGSGGLTAHIVPGRALPQRLETARALRPFKATWRRGIRATFDVDQTIQAYARTGCLIPVLAPTAERWFDLNLVVDDTPSMKVWQDTAKELATLLEQTGCFRAVRHWSLRVTGDGATVTRARLRPAGPTTRTDGRQLNIIFSDWTDPAWRSADLWHMLRRWSRALPVALLNPLPPRMWQQTRMPAEPSPLGPGVPGTANAGLSFEAPRTTPTADKGWLPIPTISLSPHSIGRWASLLMRAEPTGCEGVLMPLHGAPVVPRTETPPWPVEVDAVETFQLRASPAALRLAVLSAIQPTVSLPVLHLIRQTMVPQAHVEDIAEIVVSGLIAEQNITDAGTLRLRFDARARAQLLGMLTTDDTWALFRNISRHIADRTGHGLAVLVAHPDGTLPLPAGLEPFGEASDAALRLLGFNRPVRPQPTVPSGSPMPRPAVVSGFRHADVTQAYYFHLSHAQSSATGGDHWIRVFFRDLNDEVVRLSGAPPGTAVGIFGPTSPGFGPEASTTQAIRDARVVVALYSPEYLESGSTRRTLGHPDDAGERAVVQAVLWAPVGGSGHLADVERANELGADFPEYVQFGLGVMCRLRAYRNGYETIVRRLAGRIVEAAERPGQPIGPAAPAETVADDPSDTHFIIGVIAPTESRLPEMRSATSYGARSLAWRPFRGAERSIADQASATAHRFRLPFRVVDFNEAADLLETSPGIVLIDPWILELAEGQALLNAALAVVHPWVSLVVVTDRDDPQYAPHGSELARRAMASLTAGQGTRLVRDAREFDSVINRVVARNRRRYLSERPPYPAEGPAPDPRRPTDP